MNSFLTVLRRRRGIQSAVWTLNTSSFQAASGSEITHMSLDGVGFGEGEERFPSMISLKLLFPTFLASWGRKKKTVKGVRRCLKNNIHSLFLRLTKSSEVPSLSSSMDWMREMWTPISRWMPEHSMQVRIPRLVDSHLGSINTDNMRKCVFMICTVYVSIIYSIWLLVWSWVDGRMVQGQ